MPMIRFFGVLIFLSEHVTRKNDLQRKSSSIIIIDVNMTSKRAFLQKEMFYLIQPPKAEVLLE